MIFLKKRICARRNAGQDVELYENSGKELDSPFVSAVLTYGLRTI
jgi:hypothetical protein